jgi:hypothetical protein
MRDTGVHSFDYSIRPHARHVSPVELARVGYAFNGSSHRTARG